MRERAPPATPPSGPKADRGGGPACWPALSAHVEHRSPGGPPKTQPLSRYRALDPAACLKIKPDDGVPHCPPIGMEARNVQVPCVLPMQRLITVMNILTVEDDFLITEYLGSVLEDAGHNVTAASNADEAVEVLKSGRDIAILITDIDMPGSMDGVKLAAAVRKKWPPVKIIVTTGMHRPSSDQLPAHTVFLSKPYRPEQILEAIRLLEQTCV
jgi:CheY-like chemotaxis protein